MPSPRNKVKTTHILSSKSGEVRVLEVLALDHLGSKFPMFKSSGPCHMGHPWGKGPGYQPSKFDGLEGQDQLDLIGTDKIHLDLSNFPSFRQI